MELIFFLSSVNNIYVLMRWFLPVLVREIARITFRVHHILSQKSGSVTQDSR